MNHDIAQRFHAIDVVIRGAADRETAQVIYGELHARNWAERAMPG